MSEKTSTLPRLLVVDDDPDDVMMITEAVRRSVVEVTIDSVDDGIHVVDYLTGEGVFASQGPVRPSLVLMDLNMPLLDGVEAIRRVKARADLRATPIVVLTTSTRTADVQRAYEVGAASFITKPNRFTDLVKVIELIEQYWFRSVKLPPNLL